jgi:hypothetical protein
MPRGFSLENINVKFYVDSSSLTKAKSEAAGTGAALKKHLGTGTASATALEKRLGSVGRALSHLGPVGQIAGNALSDVSSGAAAVGGAMGLAGGIAVAALAGIAGGALYAANRYASLVERIDNYQDVTSSSAEEASRAVHMFEVLGISTATAEKAMYKLSKSVADNGDKLEALGVHIAKNADGGVNLTETLYAVADAYDAASDSNTRTKILFAAFGKGATEMIDVVKEGSHRLRELAASTKLVLTEDDIVRMREYTIHQAEVKTGWDEWVASVGQKVLPIQAAVLDSFRKGTFIQDRLTQAVKDGVITQEEAAGSMGVTTDKVEALTNKYSAEFDQQEKNKHINAELTQTIKEQEDANQKLIDSMNKVIGGYQSEESASLALRRGNLDLVDSALKVKTSQEAYVLAVKEHGKHSREAEQALRDYRRAQLDQEQTYLDVAEAARKYQAQLDLAATGSQDAALETDAYIRKLQDEANTLDKGSPLRKNLQAYIDKIKNDLPSSKTTTLYLDIKGSHAGGHGIKFEPYAAGGRPDVGVPAMVGEGGPEIFIPDRPGTIYPHSVQPQMAAALPMMAGGDTFNFHQVQTDPWQTAAEISWVKKTRRL